MVEYQDAQLDAVFHALSDRTRRGMLKAMSDGEKPIVELARPYSMTFAGASKHVRVLERAGLVRRRVAGRTHLCRLEPQRLAEAQRWIATYERFWTGRLDALEAALLDEQGENHGPD
jgi:DNA-binding transcriptional ArsR family regulator